MNHNTPRQAPVWIARALASLLALALVLATLGVSCSWGRGGATTLRLLGPSPITLDPAKSADAGSAQYIVEIFSGLVTLDGNLNVVPDIAQRWDLDSTGTAYTFYLRPGVKFQNGREVTAADFKYSIERAADPRTASRVAAVYLGDIVGVREKLGGQAREVSGVRVIDNLTLQLTIDAPKAYFLAKLTHTSAFVVDRENVASGDNWTEHPNGTGPFRLKEWRKEQRLVLERNPDFYRGAAKLDTVDFLLGGGLAMSMYENGEIDITGVGLGDIERALDPANPLHRELMASPSLGLAYIGFNTRVPPFDDAKVRQAFSHALDKQKLATVTQKGIVQIAEGILPPGMPGYTPGFIGLGYDPARARALLAASKYGGGAALGRLVLTVPGMGGIADPVTEAVVSMWRDNLGVEVEVEQFQWAEYLHRLDDHRVQAFGGLSWLADYPDPENFLDVLFHSGSAQNHTAYSNAQVDRILEQARVERDRGARLALYHQAEEQIVSDAPITPLSFGQNYALVKPYVKGYTLAPMVMPVFKEVWLER